MDTFVADVFQPRPDFEDAARFHIWSTDAREKMQHAMHRKNCPVEWAGLVIDQLGLLAIVRFQKRLILGSAKNAASSILQCLPDEQRRAVELGLRPLDEVDKDRISAWQTMADVRPRGFNKRAREEADSEEEVPLPLAKRTKTLQAFLAEVAEESSEDEGSFAPPRLALTDSAPTLAEAAARQREALRCATSAELNIRDPTSVWEHRAKREATIVLAEVGERPSQLAYIRCHRENRRLLLLQQRIRAAGGAPRRELSLLHVVQTAARLARESIIPNPGKHGRTREFVERCAAALEVLNPEAPTTIGDQSREDQLAIRRALASDGEEFYLECLYPRGSKDDLGKTSKSCVRRFHYLQMLRLWSSAGFWPKTAVSGSFAQGGNCPSARSRSRGAPCCVGWSLRALVAAVRVRARRFSLALGTEALRVSKSSDRRRGRSEVRGPSLGAAAASPRRSAPTKAERSSCCA